MAEQRKRLGAALLKLGSKAPADWTVEVFESREWPDQPEAGAGLYRIRVGGKWVNDGERSHTFFTPAGLGALLARELTTPGALANLDAGKPALRSGQLVRVYPDPNSTKWTYGCTRATARSDPFQTLDGQWRILVSVIGVVECDRVQGLDRFGRELPQEGA